MTTDFPGPDYGLGYVGERQNIRKMVALRDRENCESVRASDAKATGQLSVPVDPLHYSHSSLRLSSGVRVSEKSAPFEP